MTILAGALIGGTAGGAAAGLVVLGGGALGLSTVAVGAATGLSVGAISQYAINRLSGQAWHAGVGQMALAGGIGGAVGELIASRFLSQNAGLATHMLVEGLSDALVSAGTQVGLNVAAGQAPLAGVGTAFAVGLTTGAVGGAVGYFAERWLQGRGKLLHRPLIQEVRQSSGDLHALYRAAEIADVELRKATHDIASMTGGAAKFPPGLKKRARAQEKIDTDYAGDASRLTDISRSSIVYSSLNDLYRGLEIIRARYEIVRIKDRFEMPTPAGYRDILLNIKMTNKHIVEVQLHLKQILEVKAGRGHEIYEQIRTIEAAAAGRDYTPAEEAILDALLRESQQLYKEAFQSAQGGNR